MDVICASYCSLLRLTSLGQITGDAEQDPEHAVLPRVRVVLIQELAEGAAQDIAENLQHEHEYSPSCKQQNYF